MGVLIKSLTCFNQLYPILFRNMILPFLPWIYLFWLCCYCCGGPFPMLLMMPREFVRANIMSCFPLANFLYSLAGEYAGLTGSRLDGAEMLACGLATHFVSSDVYYLNFQHVLPIYNCFYRKSIRFLLLICVNWSVFIVVATLMLPPLHVITKFPIHCLSEDVRLMVPKTVILSSICHIGLINLFSYVLLRCFISSNWDPDS